MVKFNYLFLLVLAFEISDDCHNGWIRCIIVRNMTINP
jgi:hypothetical protein